MFGKKKSKKSMEPVNVENHIREFLLDCQIPEANEIALALGSTVISDELLEKEEFESDRRIAPIVHLYPLLQSYAALVSEGIVLTQKADEETAEIPDAFWELTRKLLEMVSFNILVGTIAQLHEMELIKVKNVSKN